MAFDLIRDFFLKTLVGFQHHHHWDQTNGRKWVAILTGIRTP